MEFTIFAIIVLFIAFAHTCVADPKPSTEMLGPITLVFDVGVGIGGGSDNQIDPDAAD